MHPGFPCLLVKTSVCTCRSPLKLDTGAFTTARVRWQALSYKPCYNFLRVVNEPTNSTLEWKTSRRKNTSNQLLTSSASYDLLFSPKMKKDGTSIERISIYVSNPARIQPFWPRSSYNWKLKCVYLHVYLIYTDKSFFKSGLNHLICLLHGNSPTGSRKLSPSRDAICPVIHIMAQNDLKKKYSEPRQNHQILSLYRCTECEIKRFVLSKNVFLFWDY